MDQSAASSPRTKGSPEAQSRSGDCARDTEKPKTKSPSPSSESSTIVDSLGDNQSGNSTTMQAPPATSTTETQGQYPTGTHLVEVGTINLRMDRAHLPSRVPVRDPTTRPQPFRPAFRPFTNHQGATNMPVIGPVWPTFGVLDDLVFPFAQSPAATCLTRVQIKGGKTVPSDQVFYSIKAQHYEGHAVAPMTDDLTPLSRTPEAAMSRLRVENGTSGLFAGRKIVSQLYCLDGSVSALPTIEGLHEGVRDVVHAVVMQTWVCAEERNSYEDYMDDGGSDGAGARVA